jgi:hypothetical protein
VEVQRVKQVGEWCVQDIDIGKRALYWLASKIQAIRADCRGLLVEPIPASFEGAHITTTTKWALGVSGAGVTKMIKTNTSSPNIL